MQMLLFLLLGESIAGLNPEFLEFFMNVFFGHILE